MSINVSQLLLAGLGTAREFDFCEPLFDPDGELHLRGPISGRARLTRTPDGILVHSEHAGVVVLECARCLEETLTPVDGVFDEEFLPALDIRTGLPIHVSGQDEQPLIDEHHELDLDETLRQSILTSLPLRPLCSAACPGLCTLCGQRLDGPHQPHPEATQLEDDDASVTATSPFARLAVLLRADQER
ncbi:MAG: YceD family protein [Chloroflexota bacterium]